MASLINSGRTSVISVFDTITTATTMVQSSINSASMAMDVIHNKAKLMQHESSLVIDEKMAMASHFAREQVAADYIVKMKELKKAVGDDDESQRLYEEAMEIMGEIKPKD